MIRKNIIISLFLIIFAESSFSSDTCNQAPNSSRITVAGGSITEILFFLGFENNIIAVDVTSNYPKKAKEYQSIGYVRNLSAEGVLSLKPTLIIGEDDIGPPSVIEQIKRTGISINIIEENHTAEGIVNKIECVGKIINKETKTSLLIDELIKPSIKELNEISKNSILNNIKVMFILTMDSGTPVVAGRKTSANGFIKMIGATNAFEDFEGWKPVGTESIINSSPDYILISNRGAHSYADLDKLFEHPAIKYTPAALNKNIIALDGMEMLGFGPRTIDSALKLATIFIGNHNE